MESLDPYYVQMLRVGFVVLRQAVEARDEPWVQAEVDLLHNIPSLIGESNQRRHLHFWSKGRPRYIEWVSAAGREWQKSRMRTYYEPIWQEMGTVLAGLVGDAPEPDDHGDGTPGV